MRRRHLILAGLAVALVVAASSTVIGHGRPVGRATRAVAGNDRDRIVYADGAHQRVVSPLPLGGDFPAWSPGSTTIAFSTRRGLATVAAGGGPPTRLPVVGACPTWSPDGTRIAFCGVGAGRPDNSTVMTISPDGSDLRTVLAGTARNSPAGWSPDGTRIAVSSDQAGDLDLYTVGADGTGLARVLHAPGGQSADAWLPDGRIVYEDTPAGADRSEVRTISPDGSHLVRYPHLPAPDPIDWLPPARQRACPAVTRPAASGPAPIGRLVDIGGRRLFLDCQGTAGPTVVLDAGLGVTSDTWAAVQRDTRRFARVCRYDRAGLGASDPGPPHAPVPPWSATSTPCSTPPTCLHPTCWSARPSAASTPSCSPAATHGRWPAWCWSTRSIPTWTAASSNSCRPRR